MKMRVLWGISIVWALLFAFLAWGSLQYAWSAEGSIFQTGEKLEAFLAAVGAVTVGGLPLYLANRLRLWHKHRERGRLERERHRIDKRIEAIDRKSGATAEGVLENS